MTCLGVVRELCPFIHFSFFLLVKQEQALHNGWSDLKTDSCLNGCDRAVSVDVLCVHQRGEASALSVCV